MNKTDKIVGDFFYLNIGTFCRYFAEIFEGEVAVSFGTSSNGAEPCSLHHPNL
jgi:hypothetical protein